MTYKIGTIGEFMKWTKSVVTDPASATAMPKRWFDSDDTAAKSLGTSASPEAMVKLLSQDNLALLHLIGTTRPELLRELAVLAHRKELNLSRTLKKLHYAGIVDFEQRAGRTRAPRLIARRVTLDLDLVGPGSVVSVELVSDDRIVRQSAAEALGKIRPPASLKPVVAEKPAVPPKKSITADYIICLEDGRKFKSLKRHLRTQYNLSPEEYREKWGLPSDYPMIAPAYAKARSALAKQMSPGAQRRRRK